MKLSEQLKALENTRAAKLAALNAIQQKSADEGRNKDEKEAEEFKDLKLEIQAIDAELADLKSLEKLQVRKARGIETSEEDDTELEVEEPTRKTKPTGVQTRFITPKLAKGVMFARYVKCVGAARGDMAAAAMLAKMHYPDTPQIMDVIKAGLVGGAVGDILSKTAVAGGTTTDATWAGPLIAYNQFAGDFIEFLRPQTIIGKFGVGGVPSLRAVPFNVHIRGQTSGGAGYWVGQGKAKPLTKADFSDVYLGFSKIASIAVLTEELLRFSSPSAEVLTRDMLAEALIARADTDFVDPAKALVANVSPASITNGVTGHASAGATAADCRADIANAMTDFITANIPVTSLVWIMPASVALHLSLLRNAFGQPEFPTINVNGGTLEGVPVITSQYVTHDTEGGTMILVSAQDVWLADDGSVTVDASREASLEMSDAPSSTAAAGTGASLVSMFQTNSVALRAERYINWQKRRSAAVTMITGANYTGG